MKPKIINSTYFYLSGLIHKNRAKHQGQIIIEQLTETVRMDGETALFMPSSNFLDAHDLVQHIDHQEYLQCLSPQQQIELGQTYMDALARAKENDRYFGRNPNEIKEKYGGNEHKALQDLSQFLERHGFKIIIPRDKGLDLISFYDIERHIVHASDENYWTGKEKKQ